MTGVIDVVDAKTNEIAHLFTVRIWLSESGTDQHRWRGKVRHVPSGEQHYFHSWNELTIVLRAMLPISE